MSKHYEVKWTDKSGNTHFGIVDSYGEDAEKAKKQGKLFIADAILPLSHLVFEKDIIDIPLVHPHWDFNGHLKKGNEFDFFVYKELQKAEELDKQAEKEGKLVGRMFQTPVGDGSAYYVVVKENKTTLKIEWRGFCADRWTDQMFGWGGTFRKKDIMRFLRTRKSLQEILE